MKILFRIDKSIRKEKILEKRTLILGSMFSVLVWLSTFHFITIILGEEFHFIIFVTLKILIGISYKFYKWMKREIMYLEYEINEDKGQKENRSERWKL